MNLIIDLYVIENEPGNRHVFTAMRRELETDLVPMAGMDIEDSVWKEPRTIKGVTINPSEGYYYIHIGEDEGPDEDACQRLVDMYKAHGWKSLAGR